MLVNIDLIRLVRLDVMRLFFFKFDPAAIVSKVGLVEVGFVTGVVRSVFVGVDEGSGEIGLREWLVRVVFFIFHLRSPCIPAGAVRLI